MKLIKLNLSIIFLTIIIFFFLFPLLTSGYVSDDAYNSLIKGILIERDESFLSYIINLNWGWLNGSGRLYPIGHLSQTLLFYFINNLIFFKICIFLIILVSIFYFRLFVIELSGVKEIGNLASLIILVFLQFRLWHDPILAFAGLIPLICLLLFMSLYYFQLYLKNNKKIHLINSIIFYTLMLLTYEVTYFFVAIFYIVALLNNTFYQSIKKIKFHLFILFLIILITIYFRINISGIAYPSISKNLSLIIVIKSFIIQTISGVSFSYMFRLKYELINFIKFYDFILLSIYFLLIFLNLKIIANKNKEHIKNKYYLFIFGLIIIFTQSFFVSISGHNTDLTKMGFGFGYITVLIQYFGFCLIYLFLIILSFEKINFKKGKEIIILIFTLFLVVNAYVNLLNNRYVVHNSNQFYKYPRELLKSAIKSEEFNKLNKSKVIIRKSRFPHDIRWFYLKNTNVEYCMIDVNYDINHHWFSWPSKCWEKYIKFDENYNIIEINDSIALSYNFDRSGEKKGKLFIAKIKKITFDPDLKKIINLYYDDIIVYDEKKKLFFEYKSLDKNFMDILKIDEKNPSEIELKSL